MKAYPGKTKVLILAFGHPDNVLSLSNAVSDKVHLSVVFVVSGISFRQGILDLGLESLPYGLSDCHSSLSLLPENVRGYINNKFSIRFIRTPTLKLIRKGGIVNLLSIYRACKVLNSEKYDSLHFNGVSGFTIYFRLFLKGFKIRIWTIHDYRPHTGEQNIRNMFFQKISVTRKFEYIQHYHYLKKSFSHYYNIPEKKVHQVYSGPFDIIKSYNPKYVTEESKYFLFFGRISKYKGLEFLIRSYSRFKNPNKPKLIIAGSGDIEFSHQYLISEEVILINRYISSEELAGLVINSLAVVLPYSDSTHSGVVATAYAFNKPVIATDVGGLNEVVIDGKTGFLVKYGNEEDLISSFVRITDHPPLLKFFEKNINNLCTNGKLSWEMISCQMAMIYNNTKTIPKH